MNLTELITDYFLEGALLGLLTGISCAVFCVPVLLGLSGRNRGNFMPVADFSYFLLGRFFSYIFTGILFSIIGISLKFKTHIDLIVKFITGGLLLYWGIKTFIMIDKEKKVCALKKYSAYMPLMAGVLTGINICPPFITGIARVTAIGNVYAGIVYFFGFYITTSLFLLPGLAGIFFKYKKEFKVIISFFSIVYGLIFIIMAFYNFKGF